MVAKTEKEPINGVSIEKAAEIINKSPHCTRQLMLRGKIQGFKHGRTTLIDINSALTYHARKKGLPSWEENTETVKSKTFVSLEFTANQLRVQPAYVQRLIKNDELEAYVTASGDIMISRDSVNVFLRKPHASTKEL